MGAKVYDIKPPTCCGGCCVNVCDSKHGGMCSCRIPFYIYNPGQIGDNSEIGEDCASCSVYHALCIMLCISCSVYHALLT
jgi:hypothetical protein